MATITRRLIFLVLSLSVVQCRILSLNSYDDHLISDGVETQESSYQTSIDSVRMIPSSCDHQLFKQFDTDGDKAITKDELKQLVSSVKFGEFQMKEEHVLKELFKEFDEDNNNIIDEPEFVEGVRKWLSKAISDGSTQDPSKIINEFDKNMWKEPVYGKGALIISVFQVSLGIVILTFLGGPLMGSILQLSYAMRFPSFIISFVVVPCTMNLRAALTALFPASQKSERTASLTFSEVSLIRWIPASTPPLT